MSTEYPGQPWVYEVVISIQMSNQLGRHKEMFLAWFSDSKLSVLTLLWKVQIAELMGL